MKTLIIYLSVLFFTITPLTTTHDFIFSDWQLPPGAAMTHFKGKEALFIPKGVALYEEQQLQDGILEVDIADDNSRGFAGLVFHHDGASTYEEVYLRLHKSRQPDALQYAPVYKHSSSWVLYPEHQVVLDFHPDAWTHLKVEIQGNIARIFLNHSVTPALIVSDLKIKDSKAGRIGLKALEGAYFSNFRFSPASQVANFMSAPVADAPIKISPTVISRWQVSPTFMHTQDFSLPLVLPNMQKLSWETLPTEASGLLNLAVHREKRVADQFENNTDDYVWLKLELTSSSAQLKQFFFDYSNKAQVFLNGKPFFIGNNSFRAKGLLYRGDIDLQLQTTSLFLPLKKGRNTLLIALSSKANGWGLLGRFADLAGIALTTPSFP